MRVWVVTRTDGSVVGVYTTWQKAVHAQENAKRLSWDRLGVAPLHQIEVNAEVKDEEYD